MKKRTKLLSIMLAILMTATLIPTALVQVFATDSTVLDTATDDEATNVPKLTSIEITNDSGIETVTKDYYAGESYVNTYDLIEGLEMLLTFDNGTTYNYAFDTDGFIPACFYDNGIADIYDYDIDKLALHIVGEEEDATTDLPTGEQEVTFELMGCTATKKFNIVENEYVLNPVVKLEVTKLPDKVFEAPFIQNVDTEENLNNSVASNMHGAEVTIYRQNGEKEVKSFDSPVIYSGITDIGSYGVYLDDSDVDQGIYTDIVAEDLGNYQARISIWEMTDLTVDFTDKHGTAGDSATPDQSYPARPDETVNPDSTTPAGTQDGSTSDTAVNNGKSNSSGNGTVATGSQAVSAILLAVLLSACGMMYFIGRKKEIF